jgi:hypothetical protein
MSFIGHVATSIITAGITLCGVFYLIEEQNSLIHGKIEGAVDKLDKLINKQASNLSSTVAKAHQLDNLAALMIDKNCSQTELKFDLGKGTVAGISINEDIGQIAKNMPCLNGAQRGSLLNAKLLDREEFGFFVAPPSEHPISPFPSFSMSAKKPSNGLLRRELSIIGESSGGIQGMGYKWDYPVSTYDKLFSEPEFSSKTQFKTETKTGVIHHTRLYKRDYGCMVVAFGGHDKELEKQQARKITMVNQPCKDITTSFLDMPSIYLNSSERFALRSFQW